MAGRKNSSERFIVEKEASDGISHDADVHNAGDTSRSADKTGDGETYNMTTKSEVLSALMNSMSGMDLNKLNDIYKGLNSVSGKAARPADKKAGETAQVHTSPSDAKGMNPNGDPADAGGSAPYAHSVALGNGENSPIYTSPTSVKPYTAKEDIDTMFDGDELSEELMEKATIVFEAAVNARIIAESAKLEEEFNSRLTEAVEEIRSEIVEHVNNYLSYAVAEWVEENEVAIESGIKTEMAEEFMLNLKQVFEANYVDVSDTNVDVMAEMVEKIEELETALNEQIEKTMELERENEDSQVDSIFNSMCEGLAKTQAEKLAVLAEGVTYESPADFERKLHVIRETYFPSNRSTSNASSLTEETVEDDGDADHVPTTGPMAAYVQAISKTVKK